MSPLIEGRRRRNWDKTCQTKKKTYQTFFSALDMYLHPSLVLALVLALFQRQHIWGTKAPEKNIHPFLQC